MVANLLVLLAVLCVALAQTSSDVPPMRPASSSRTYVSPAVDALISNLTPLFLDKNVATLFSNCLPNTLDTTVSFAGTAHWDSSSLDSFVITGDIDALWLRDSANQVMPYVPYAPEDAKLQSLLEGLIARQAHSVNLDSFANSFNYNASGAGAQSDIRTPRMTPSVFEGKYEIDSLGAFLKISYWYYRAMGASILPKIMTNDWLTAIGNTLNTIETMQSDTGMEKKCPYLFSRETYVATDTLFMSGRGPPAKPFGLSRSLFRPSDDAVTLPYNIPGNAMACVELKHLEDMLKDSTTNTAKVAQLKARAASISTSLCSALNKVVESSKLSKTKTMPYEVDGDPATSGQYLMDDANIPSLLSLPFLGYMGRSEEIYLQTRDFVWSKNNPFYFSGTQGDGIGGPHVGPDFAWPMSLIMRAMTSNSDDEVKSCLDLLVKSSAGTGFLHESFNVNDVKDYTRSWFAWVNGLFGELVIQLVNERPQLIIQSDQIALAQSYVKVPISLQAQLDLESSKKK